MGKGDHSETLLLVALFYKSTPSCLKVIGEVCAGSHVVMCRRPYGGVAAHVILVSALGPNPSLFLFLGDFYSIGGPFGQGQGLGLGPGLDNLSLGLEVHEFNWTTQVNRGGFSHGQK